ncbi:recombinase family protein [Parablautia intestinalis]|uniref:recombinase family protein n=1 Tax=Parablautia intestinalis TaxID=2320100 RepID=UPI00256F2CBA|nr:recombinase family protein [Parablautia intestinalis]
MDRIPRCAIYIRVSTEEQHLNGLSLPAQKKALTEYAEKNNYSIAGYYADEGISARKPMKHRRGLLQLLEDVKRDKIDMILVTKLDRWFRNIKDYNITEEILQAHNCHWKTIYENYDSSTANGQMVINIMLSVNQAECDRTSERIRAVLDYKRSIGEVTSGMCACYGYKVVNNRLVKDESVSHIVEDAYQYYFTCYSIRSTLHYLKTKYGDKAPSNNQTDRFFKNETYAGKDKDNLNYCEPYITLEQFQKIRQITVRKTYSMGNHDPYLFSSLIKCPWCGNNYTGYRKKHKLKNGGESVYIKYRCGNKFNRHSCAHLTEHIIEEYMLTHVCARLDEELAQIEFNRQQRANNTENPEILRDEMERLNILFQKGRITERYYDEQYELLEKKLSEIDKASKYLSQESYSDLIRAFSGNWQDLYQQLDKPHKQAFWKSTIKDIQIDKETHQICGFNFLANLE